MTINFSPDSQVSLIKKRQKACYYNYMMQLNNYTNKYSHAP